VLTKYTAFTYWGRDMCAWGGDIYLLTSWLQTTSGLASLHF